MPGSGVRAGEGRWEQWIFIDLWEGSMATLQGESGRPFSQTAWLLHIPKFRRAITVTRAVLRWVLSGQMAQVEPGRNT